MENKTISHLSTKAWYRSLKVLFILVFIVTIGIFNVIAFSSGIKKVDLKNTIVNCDNKDKTNFSLNEIGTSLNPSEFPNNKLDYAGLFKGYNEYSIKEILRACYPKTVNNFGTSFVDNNNSINDIYDFQKAAEIKDSYGFTEIPKLSQEQIEPLNTDYKDYVQKSKGVYGTTKTRFLNFNYKLFDITPQFTYDSFLKLFFIGNLVILIVFEIMRRIFYYIALGTIKPKK